jgi:hypothetical protein
MKSSRYVPPSSVIPSNKHQNAAGETYSFDNEYFHWTTKRGPGFFFRKVLPELRHAAATVTTIKLHVESTTKESCG